MTEFTAYDIDMTPVVHEDLNLRLLLGQLERVDLLLQRYTVKACVQANLHDHIVHAYLLPEEEFEARLTLPKGAPHWLTWSNEIAPLQAPSCPLLDQLQRRFDLTDFERDVLLLGLLPYFESRYYAVFAALQGGQNKKLVSFELALRLLCESASDQLVQETCFLPQSPLLSSQLINVGKRGDQQGEGWTQTLFQTDLSVYYFLTGQRHLPASLMGCAEWLSPPEPGWAPEPVLRGLHAQQALGDQRPLPVMLLRGPADSGRAFAVASCAKTLQRQTLELDMSRLPEADKDALPMLTQALREVRMRQACLVIRSLTSLLDERSNLLTSFAQQLQQPGLQVICLMDRLASMLSLPQVSQLLVEMPVLDSAQKQIFLRHALAPLTASSLDIDGLSQRLRFTPQTLPQMIQEAEYYRRLRDPAAPLIETDLYTASRLRAQQNFGKQARRIEPKRTFKDLIVGEELSVQLGEILIATKHRERVLEKGFGAKIGYGTGISALFYGESGTGKTMAAEVIAGQLGVDLIQIDLAAVVSKWIGETEKNLSRIFDLAEADAGVLFFDEADALFGKRSAVEDAKDRHANIEVSYLLQRLESYPGLVILATNNRGHLDDAFSRRFSFITQFPFPQAPLRERMWRQIWPQQVQLADEVDLVALSLRADFTGANIRNVALLATWLAEEEGTASVCQRHIDLAIKRELSKIGRLAL